MRSRPASAERPVKINLYYRPPCSNLFYPRNPVRTISTSAYIVFQEESSATRSVRSATDEDGDVDPPAPAAGPAVASPLMTSMEHRDIGWMCGEPMADYAHVVFEAVDHDEEGER